MDYVIKTDRLLLRPLVEGDLNDIYNIRSNEVVNYYMTWVELNSLDQIKSWFEEMVQDIVDEKVFRWGILYEDRLIGVISFEAIVRRSGRWSRNTADLAFYILPEFHNQGIVTEAAKEVLSYGFSELMLHKVTVGHLSENSASQRVVEKLGFREIGVKKEDCFFNNRWWDNCLYEMIEGDWKK